MKEAHYDDDFVKKLFNRMGPTYTALTCSPLLRHTGLLLSWFAAFGTTWVCNGQSEFPKLEAESLDEVFAEYPEGCISIFDLKNSRWTRHNPDRCRERLVPASTFKIIHALIALEAGVIDGPNHELKWDGNNRSIKAWNRDHDLRSAISRSVVWYFEEVAERVPPEQMSSLLSGSDYGNQKTSGEQPFWIQGDLAISSDEQVRFLQKLHTGKLPFQRMTMETVKKLIMLDNTANYTLYGKTGWAQPDGGNLGWFVGWLDTPDNTFFFATNIEGENTGGFGQARKTITMDVLRRIGAIPQDQ